MTSPTNRRLKRGKFFLDVLGSIQRPSLGDCKLRMRPNIRRMKRQYDAAFGNAGFEQPSGDALLGAIALNPDLVADDVEMDEDTVHAAGRFQPCDTTR
jgi:hypothetical protein